MTTPPPVRRRARSARALKIFSSVVTFFTFGGMTAFAALNLQNPAAPLKPPVSESEPTATPAPTRTAVPRQRVAPQIPLATVQPLTRTHRS